MRMIVIMKERVKLSGIDHFACVSSDNVLCDRILSETTLIETGQGE